MHIPSKPIFVALTIVITAFFMARPELTASDHGTKKQTLQQMKAATIDQPAPAEPSALKEFRSKTHVPLDTEAELRKKRAALLAKNTQLKRKEFQKGARVRALAQDPSLSQLPDYQKTEIPGVKTDKETTPAVEEEIETEPTNEEATA